MVSKTLVANIPFSRYFIITIKFNNDINIMNKRKLEAELKKHNKYIKDYQAALDRGEKFVDTSVPVKSLYVTLQDNQEIANRLEEIRHLFG
jgi:hypothetical protein